MWIHLQHTRIGRMRLLDTNTANESSCFRKNLPSMFVLIYPFTSQIFCINNDIMQRFTYSEKNRDDRLKYNGIIHFLLAGGDLLGVSWCQRRNYSSTRNLHILDYFHILHLLLRQKNKMQPFYLRRLFRHNVDTLFVLCCKFAYEIKLSERRQKN